MKLGILSAIVVLAVPLVASAQSVPQKRAGLEEGLRVHRFICDGIAGLRSRGSSDYSAADLAQCLAQLDAQRVEYLQYMTAENQGQHIAAAAPHQLITGVDSALAVANR